MPGLLRIAVISGFIAGILVGGFDNAFSVPVENRAIELEEARAAALAPAEGAVEEADPLVPIWVQSRIGEPIFRGLLGVIWGLLFGGGFSLLRRITPDWHPLATASVVGALGYWTLVLFPFIKYPMNPPGVGDAETLLSRQLFQTLFWILSILGTVGVLMAFQRIKSTASAISDKRKLYGLALAVYAAFALIIVFAIPGNPDPTPVPIDLLELFRTLAMIGHFLHWALLAVGVGLALMWSQRSGQNSPTLGSGDRSAGAPVR